MRKLLIFVSFCIFLFSSCVRDLTCDCSKKKGARLLFTILTDTNQLSYVAEKRRYFPILDYDKDTGYRAVMRQMKKTYDSIYKNTKINVFIGVQDSFGYETIRIRGAELDRYRREGYTYKCWE